MVSWVAYSQTREAALYMRELICAGAAGMILYLQSAAEVLLIRQRLSLRGRAMREIFGIFIRKRRR